MTKITLQSIANLENENTAVAQINSNSGIIQTAFDNTVSRDGTTPNTMTGNVDFSGGGRIINLGKASTQGEPVRKQEFDSAVFGNTVVPTVAGTANQIVATASGITYTLSFPTAMTMTGLTLTGGTYAGATFTTPNFGTSSVLAASVSDETGSGALVFATTPTLVTPVIGAATGTSVALTGGATLYNATAVPAGGTTGSGIKLSSTSNLGVFFGSGLPTLSAAQGSLYLRTDGSSTTTRMYINTNGSTTWTNVVSTA